MFEYDMLINKENEDGGDEDTYSIDDLLFSLFI